MTREQWLLDSVALMRPEFVRIGHPLDIEVHISVGWPSSGGLGSSGGSRTIGECWGPEVSADGSAQIFISPAIADPVKVLATVRHELVHAAVGIKAKHGPVFARAAKKLGLAGKPTATFASEELLPWLAEITDRLGAYPHPALSPFLKEKKQGTRMLKASCPACGYTVRLTRKWVERGLPTCPCIEQREFVLEDEEEGEA